MRTDPGHASVTDRPARTDALRARRRADGAAGSLGPVFVGGADRSGTTLMYALLASHPNIAMVRRTNLFRWFDGRYGDLAVPANLERCLDDLLAYRRIEHLCPDRERLEREFAGGPASYGRLFDLLLRHHAERAGRPRWGDKSLHTEHHADRILEAFPDARIIHMVRDPRDRYASVRRRGGGDLDRVGAATGRWLLSVRAAARNRRRHPDSYLVVRYEDLVVDPAGLMRQVCDFIGEPYDPRMLTMDAVPDHRVAGANSSFGDVDGGAITTRAVGRFRQVLEPAEVAFIETIAGRRLRALGYVPERPSLSSREMLRFVGEVLPVQGARMAGWLLAMRRARRSRGSRVPTDRLRPANGASRGHERAHGPTGPTMSDSSRDRPVSDTAPNGRGVCVWFTGRSGAGKSTVTRALVGLLEADGHTVSVLDVVPELGKAPGERTSEHKLLRKGVVAREVVRHGGIAVCVTVSARRNVRDTVRDMVGPPSFVEVFVDAPAEVCEARRAARPRRPVLRKRVRHRLREWVGRLRPGERRSFEEPTSPDLRIDSTRTRPEDAALALYGLLQARGFLVAPITDASLAGSRRASATTAD